MGWASAHLEGSRFGTYPRDLVIFVTARARPQTLLNRRLPGTFQSAIGLSAR
jgi:hypothetical protein